jgi:hypothetical protein
MLTCRYGAQRDDGRVQCNFSRLITTREAASGQKDSNQLKLLLSFATFFNATILAKIVRL